MINEKKKKCIALPAVFTKKKVKNVKGSPGCPLYGSATLTIFVYTFLLFKCKHQISIALCWKYRPYG